MEIDDCVFCNIAARKVPANIYFEDQDLLVVPDIFPKAPVHMLIISREHIPSISSITEQHQALLGKMIFKAKQVAEEQGVSATGYKLAFNVGKQGGQIVPHLHLHLLGGKDMA